MKYFRLLFRSGESLAYVFIYDNFRIIDLKWDSALTWYLAALGVDFCYYWVHRANHGNYPRLIKKSINLSKYSATLGHIQFTEVHVLWAQHQVHHSSEEFNLAVGLRQSALQGWCGFVRLFYVHFFNIE